MAVKLQYHTLFTSNDQIGLLQHICQRPLGNPIILQHKFRPLTFWSGRDCYILAVWRIVLVPLVAVHISPENKINIIVVSIPNKLPILLNVPSILYEGQLIHHLRP